MLPLSLAVALIGCGFVAGCQKQDDHPPFAPACVTDCKPVVGIAVGSGSGGTTVTTPTPDAGFDAGTLTGSVFQLADDSFVRETAFTQQATVVADGASGASVSATWDGMNPYQLSGVAVEPTNWINVAPAAIQGDTLPTLQAVETDATDSADLVVVNSAVIDSVLMAVSATRAPAFGQVVLFVRNAGTGQAVAGVHVVMNGIGANGASEAPAYAAASGWVSQDDTTTTDSSGLIMFGNVELPASGSTQTVTVTRPATATTAAATGGTFPVKVVGGAVTIAAIGVQL